MNDQLAQMTPGRFEAALKTREVRPAPAEIERLYALRDAFIRTLRAKGLVDVREIGELDRLGRCQVASDHWDLCTQEARDALLEDPHHQVRACASVSESSERGAMMERDRCMAPSM